MCCVYHVPNQDPRKKETNESAQLQTRHILSGHILSLYRKRSPIILYNRQLHNKRGSKYATPPPPPPPHRDYQALTGSSKKAAQYLDGRTCDVPIAPRYAQTDPGTIVPFVLATILFVVRMAAKSWGLGGGWGGDDYSLIGAYVCGLSHCMHVIWRCILTGQVLSVGGFAVYLTSTFPFLSPKEDRSNRSVTKS